MSALFVTATGTGVGKTFVTAGVIRHLRAAGRAVDAIKPVMSGYDDNDAAASDAGVLLAALGRAVTAAEVARLSPFRFRAPLSPDLAAAREGRRLAADAVIEHSRRAIAAAADAVLIEGIGGVMVPLDGTRTVLDWMVALNVPLLLVTGSYLGSLSHTLTALEVLELSDLTVAGIVVSETADSGVSLTDTVEVLSRFSKGVDVVALPRLAAGDAGHPAFAQIAALLG